MANRVPIEDLQVGDLVELPTKFFMQSIRLTRIAPHEHGIKFTGRGDDGVEWYFTKKHGDSVVRLKP